MGFGEENQQVISQSRAWGGFWEQSNRYNKNHLDLPLTVSQVILKTQNSAILVLSAGKSPFPER